MITRAASRTAGTVERCRAQFDVVISRRLVCCTMVSSFFPAGLTGPNGVSVRAASAEVAGPVTAGTWGPSRPGRWAGRTP